MNDQLWKRVEAALDARVNPLDDPRLREELAADPEALEAVHRLMQRIDVLSARVRPTRTRVRRLGIAAVAAGVLALGMATFSLLQGNGQPPGAGEDSLAAARPQPAVSLVVQTIQNDPPRGERIVIEPQRVLTWNLEKR